jgi:uncharacterized protein (TIGR02466 family)
LQVDLASLLRTGLEYEQAGLAQQAEQVYRHVLDAHPGHAEASYRLGGLAERAGRADLAVGLLRAAVANAPGESKYVIQLGSLLVRQGGLDEALALFEDVTLKYPDQGELYEKLGILYHLNSQAGQAEVSYRRALERNRNLPQAHANLGRLLYETGQADEAIAMMYRAIELAPTDAGLRATLGSYFINLGKLEAGIAAFQGALGVQPNLAEAHAGLAAAYLQAGDAASALLAARRGRLRVGFANNLVAAERDALHELGDDEAARQLVDLDQLVYCELLPVPAEYASLETFNAALAAELRSNPSLRWEPVGKTTRAGWQSGGLHEHPTLPYQVFERQLRQKVDDFISRLPAGPLHPFFSRKPRDYGLYAWTTILQSGGHQAPHMHARGWLSGVYYVELPKLMSAAAQDHAAPEHAVQDQAGWIEFGRPPKTYVLRREPCVRAVQPRAGMMVLFPSYVFHRTIPFQSGGQRISIAFDVYEA